MDKQAHVTTEQVSYGYSESEIPTEEYALHCHNFYEVYFFLDGDVDYLVEGTQYKPTPNSLLLLSPNVFHGVKINGSRPYKRFSVHFHPDILSVERRVFLLSAFPSFENQPMRKFIMNRWSASAFRTVLKRWRIVRGKRLLSGNISFQSAWKRCSHVLYPCQIPPEPDFIPLPRIPLQGFCCT